MTTAIHFFLVCPNPIDTVAMHKNVARVVLNSNRVTRITPIINKLFWLTIEDSLILKTASLVYSFLQTVYPKYFDACLSSCTSLYNSRRCQGDSELV